jgi:hypothetical protein
MDPHAKYNLTRVINACGKMTAFSGARVLGELQAAAGR